MTEEIAKKMSKDIVKYKNKDKLSLIKVYNLLLSKYGEFTDKEKDAILIKTITFFTQDGYDIDCIEPLKFKKYK